MWHALPLLVTLVATAEVKGTPEPCGCTSDPLGDGELEDGGALFFPLLDDDLVGSVDQRHREELHQLLQLGLVHGHGSGNHALAAEA